MSGSRLGAPLVALLVAALLWAAPARAAQAPDVDTASVHTVVGGDTLWSLAEHFYGDADLWVLLFEANRESVPGPDRLRPGQMLQIPARPGAASGTDGEGAPARLATIAVGQGGSAPVADASAPVPVRRAEAPPAPIGAEEPSPAPVGRAEPARPGEASGLPSFAARAPFLVTRSELERLSDSIGSSSPRVARPGDRIQLVLGSTDFEVGRRFHSFQTGRTLDGAAGTVAIPTALLRVEGGSAESATALVEAVFGRVAPGDPVRPLPREGVMGPPAVPVSSGAEIAVLASAEGKPILQPGDWVFLEVGPSDEVVVGDEFVPAWVADAERQPGRLQVVRVDSSHATARIVRLGGSTFEPGRVVRLDRRRR